MIVCFDSMPFFRWKLKIIAVIDTTFAVVKRKPEKNQACTGIEPYDLCDTGVAL